MGNIETERTILRRFQLSDLHNMILLESDPEVMKFTPSRLPQSIEKTEARLSAHVEKEAAYNPLGVWAVELKHTREFIGWFMLLKTEFEMPELGFMIAKKHWGNGFATEVAQALINCGTNELKYPGIAAVADRNNSTSIHILQKLGFRKVSTRTKYDKVLDKDAEADVFELRRSANP